MSWIKITHENGRVYDSRGTSRHLIREDRSLDSPYVDTYSRYNESIDNDITVCDLERELSRLCSYINNHDSHSRGD